MLAAVVGKNLRRCVIVGGLEVTFTGTLCHCRQRAHAAIGLEGAALVQNCLAGTLFRARQQ
jgi:hypothetical protein